MSQKAREVYKFLSDSYGELEDSERVEKERAALTALKDENPELFKEVLTYGKSVRAFQVRNVTDQKNAPQEKMHPAMDGFRGRKLRNLIQNVDTNPMDKVWAIEKEFPELEAMYDLDGRIRVKSRGDDRPPALSQYVLDPPLFRKGFEAKEMLSDMTDVLGVVGKGTAAATGGLKGGQILQSGLIKALSETAAASPMGKLGRVAAFGLGLGGGGYLGGAAAETTQQILGATLGAKPGGMNWPQVHDEGVSEGVANLVVPPVARPLSQKGSLGVNVPNMLNKYKDKMQRFGRPLSDPAREAKQKIGQFFGLPPANIQEIWRNQYGPVSDIAHHAEKMKNHRVLAGADRDTFVDADMAKELMHEVTDGLREEKKSVYNKIMNAQRERGNASVDLSDHFDEINSELRRIKGAIEDGSAHATDRKRFQNLVNYRKLVFPKQDGLYLTDVPFDHLDKSRSTVSDLLGQIHGKPKGDLGLEDRIKLDTFSDKGKFLNERVSEYANTSGLSHEYSMYKDLEFKFNDMGMLGDGLPGQAPRGIPFNKADDLERSLGMDATQETEKALTSIYSGKANEALAILGHRRGKGYAQKADAIRGYQYYGDPKTLSILPQKPEEGLKVGGIGIMGVTGIGSAAFNYDEKDPTKMLTGAALGLGGIGLLRAAGSRPASVARLGVGNVGRKTAQTLDKPFGRVAPFQRAYESRPVARGLMQNYVSPEVSDYSKELFHGYQDEKEELRQRLIDYTTVD